VNETENRTGLASWNKVAQLIDKYELSGVGAELEEGWTATGDAHRSLRSLATDFNTQILLTALRRADINTADRDPETILETLTEARGDEVDRVRLRRRLERNGVDTDALESDFVTYQAIRSYLKDVRDAEYEPSDRDRIASERETLQKLRGRTTTVTETKLEQLGDTGELAVGEFQILVDIKVLCDECGSQYGVDELLERGGCECKFA
jgi:hypothetical protein